MTVHDNTFNHAKKAALAATGIKSFHGSLDTGDRHDFLRFKLKHRSSLNALLNSDRLQNVEIKLFNEAKQQIASGDRGQFVRQFIKTLDAGTYFIQISQKQGKEIHYQLDLLTFDFSTPASSGFNFFDNYSFYPFHKDLNGY